MKPIFPFGSPSKKVEQHDRSPKKVFVLGAHASAVHAKWIDVDGHIKALSLPVASEPYVFWKGENPGRIIKEIKMPPELGRLRVADKKYNGIFGKLLDKFVLDPLGYTGKDTWSCYITPYAVLNPVDIFEIDSAYKPLERTLNLTKSTVQKYYHHDLLIRSRAEEILTELEESKADTIILLGEIPIKHFLSRFSKYKRLSDFGTKLDDYGRIHNITINGKMYSVIPLIDPIQAKEEKTHIFSKGWDHKYWMTKHLIIKLSTKFESKKPYLVTN